MSFYRRFPYTNLNDINLDWIMKKVKALVGLVDEKQDKPASAGTAGQVLGLDENLDPVWLDQSGGGGGTSNYNSLTNKPQIESVTLSGNKTAAELGLARASDVPTKTSDLTNDSGFVNATEAAAAAPVQSVNGLSGGDVHIAIPSASSALPQMDGAASAGSNFSKFARGDHVHPTDTTRAAAAELATYVRPNLLDNWYFVGGGSQLGYGTFPINQRGQTVYQTAGADAIDRWKLNANGTPSATLNSDGLTLASGKANGDWCLIQELTVSSLRGKTVTASIKVESVTGRGYIHLYVNPTIPLGSVDITSAGVYSVKFTVPTNTTRIRFVIGAPTSMVVSACKVEIGTTQTLAHQESGAWVLNDVPDYGEQLLRCQHYAVLLPSTSAYNGYSNSETIVRIAVPCPAQFAGAPSLQYGGTGFSNLRLIGGGVSLAPTAATASIAGNEIVLEFTVSGATKNMPYALKNNGATILIYAL